MPPLPANQQMIPARDRTRPDLSENKMSGNVEAAARHPGSIPVWAGFSPANATSVGAKSMKLM